MIKAVDEYQDLLRVSVASVETTTPPWANRRRRPSFPMFLGNELTGILEAIEHKTPYSPRETEKS